MEMKKPKFLNFGKFKKTKKNLEESLENLSTGKTPRGIYLAVVVVVVFFSFYHIGYAKRIIPGVRIGDVFVGGMTYGEAVDAVSGYLETLDTNYKLIYQGKEFKVSGEDLKLEYDVESTVLRAFELGRTGKPLVDTKDKLASLVKTIRVKAYYTVDSDKLSNFFARVRGEINEDPRDAHFVLANGILEIEPSYEGRAVDDQQVYDYVIYTLEKMNFRDREVKVMVVEPDIKKHDLEKVYSEVEKIIFDPLTVKYEDKKWVLSPDELLSFLEVEKESLKIDLKTDKNKLEGYIDKLAREVNELPRGSVKEGEDGKVVEFDLIKGGKEMDEDKFTEDFKSAYFNGDNTVEISMNEIENLSDPSKYGIFALIGEGSSRFYGSAAERVHNLTLAAARTDGVIVPPDGVYSFNNSVGSISAENGYDTGWIISGGRTVLGEGGGVCQTSTTLFRAVLDSGLPVVTRHPHAYRVGYYELDRPVGFDASIYQPSLDFQFKNDTPNHVLVQSGWDLSTATLWFKLYGTPDGREVELSKPVVSNLTPPPEAEYKDDPNLPKGTTKQIDWAAWGANVYFTREVTRGDRILYEDKFASAYQPWKAVYLVGTKEN